MCIQNKYFNDYRETGYVRFVIFSKNKLLFGVETGFKVVNKNKQYEKRFTCCEGFLLYRFPVNLSKDFVFS